MKKVFFAICLLFVLSAFSVQAKLFELTEYTLSNGMKVIVVPNHKAPIVKHMVWYKVGSVDEKPGKGGSAHLLEHLMFRGTKQVPGAEFNRIMQVNGAESNAFTSQDFTAYHQGLDISRLELAMYLEADRMTNLDFSDEDFATERDIVYQERKQVVDNQPFSAFLESLQRALWQTHPYANPISGTEAEILSLTPEDVRDIYHRYYSPNNAILIISGDIEPKTAYRLAEKYYGEIPAAPGKEVAKFPILLPNMKNNLRMQLPRVEIARIIRKYIAPSYNTDKNKIYAYMVLSRYLGEGETSELYKDLVLKQQKAVAVSTSYNFTSRSLGSFALSAVPQPGVSVDELRNSLDAAIVAAVSQIDNKQIEKIKNKMLIGLIYLKDNPFDAADIVGQLSSVGMSLEEIENYADNIRNVSTDSVKAAAKELLNKSSFVEGIAEPLSREKQND